MPIQVAETRMKMHPISPDNQLYSTDHKKPQTADRNCAVQITGNRFKPINGARLYKTTFYSDSVTSH